MTAGTLYIVATPIGNLSDFSPRAEQTLKECGFIAAEDTRVTMKLLNHLGVRKPLVSCYKQNEKNRADEIIGRILAGEDCALCSDAGTPAVSDPGEEIVRAARQAGIRVVPVPGCCAAVTALSASGMPSVRFCFEGFLPVPAKDRRERLASLAGEERTMIFYEAPHRLRKTLKDLYEAFGDRRMTVSRELTKIHEETLDLTLTSAIDHFGINEPRGEFVLIIEGAAHQTEELSPEDSLALVKRLREEEGLSLSEACKQAAALSGQTKGVLYKAALEAGL